MKYMVIGYSGSGKSTLSKFLSDRYNLPLLYLDKTYWLPSWERRKLDEQIEIVKDFMIKNNEWVIDGNYPKVLLKERLEQADKIIFMNFNRFNCLYRAYKRYFTYKNKPRESFVEGCEETMDFEFITWILFKSRIKQKNIYKDIITNYKDKVIIIKNQKELDKFKN